MKPLHRALIVFALLLASVQARATGPAAMIFGTDAVSSPDSVSLPTGNDYWFTQGNGTSIQGTQVPSYWVNKVGGELDTLIEFCNSLNMSAYNQALGCIQTITSTHGEASFGPGTATWTVPANVTSVKVRLWAGGGGGGGGAAGQDGAGGGGAGGYTEGRVNVTPGSVIPISVGAAGTGGAPGSNGTSGSNTLWNSGALSGTGGGPGLGASANNVSTGGTGGVAAGGAFTAQGGNGLGGGVVAITISGLTFDLYNGGSGGAALFGSVSPGNYAAASQAYGFGTGGAGGANGGNGSSGGGGFMILDW